MAGIQRATLPNMRRANGGPKQFDGTPGYDSPGA
jgi:hypothetical protein